MIDRHHSHLAPTDATTRSSLHDANAPWTSAGARLTPKQPVGVTPENEKLGLSREKAEVL